MAVYLSPGVYPREIDLSTLPSAVGALMPAFIGTANKGPVNEPTFISNSQQFIDTFGEPFPESYLGYAVLAYFEEGTRAWVLRVGVECEEGQVDDLADICIDTSGARESGWGRVALFQGIAYGELCTREISSDNPLVFHNALVYDIVYNDIDPTDPTIAAADDATLQFVDTTGGVESEWNGYTGDIDDAFTVLITSDPNEDTSTAQIMDGAGYRVIRQSDGEVVDEGTLQDPTNTGTSQQISIGDGLIFQIVVTTGRLSANDTFTFSVRPNNLEFGFIINFSGYENGGSGTYRIDSMADAPGYGLNPDNADAAIVLDRLVQYDSASDYADDVNTIINLGTDPDPDYAAIAQDDDTVCFRTTTAGEMIQIMPGSIPWDASVQSSAFALEVGITMYAYDIPRAHLLCTDNGPYAITSSNNLVNITVKTQTENVSVEFTLAASLNTTNTSLAIQLNAAGIKNGHRYWSSYAIWYPGGERNPVIVTDEGPNEDNRYSQLQLMADYSHIKTLKFAEETGVLYPYTGTYESFRDTRVVLPDYDAITGQATACTTVPIDTDQCLRDTAYLENIVGFLVAKTPGTWIDEYRIVLNQYQDEYNPLPNRYILQIYDSNNLEVDSIEDLSFDSTDDRYIVNVINEGSTIGGVNGNSYVQWVERPSVLSGTRNPSLLSFTEFTGAANGIPTDATYSTELDRAVIGNPALETGIYAFQNPELYDITLLLTPGFSSGAVIAQCLQLCEGRGDVLAIIDPPFGLRPQQVVDWHNGMLYSNLSAAINSSYGALYFPWLKIFDQFNGDEIWIPPSGHASSVYARTATVAEQWFAPAGLRRGRLLTALDTEVDLTQGERDLLYGYRNAVNPIVNFPQDGITVWGQRTLQRMASALDRVNVRMLLIYIKKNATVFLRDFIFEPNDAITRSQVTAVSNSFLADIQARRGLTAYKVICDDTNNTPERIDRNELWVSYLLKPTRAIEFIVLNLAVLRTSQSFAAEEVLAAAGVVTSA